MNPNSHLCVTQYNTHVKTPVNINGLKTITVINSGAIKNFMLFLFAPQNHIQKKIKKSIRIGNNQRVIKNGKRKNNPVTNINSAIP